MDFDRPPLILDPAMARLYTERLGTFAADATSLLTCPPPPALVREKYRRRTGTTVDGVVEVRLQTEPLAA